MMYSPILYNSGKIVFLVLTNSHLKHIKGNQAKNIVSNSTGRGVGILAQLYYVVCNPGICPDLNNIRLICSLWHSQYKRMIAFPYSPCYAFK